MQTVAHFGEIKYTFFEIFGVLAQIGGWASADIVQTRGGLNFTPFYQASQSSRILTIKLGPSDNIFKVILLGGEGRDKW